MDLRKALNAKLQTRYGTVSRGRYGGEGDEMIPLFYNEERFELLSNPATSHFWLSSTPEYPSMTWGNAVPRMVTWGRFRDRQHDTKLLVFNTHFHNMFAARDDRIRLQSADLVLKRLSQMGRGYRLIVTGDFNTGDHSSAYGKLFSSGLLDTYRIRYPQRNPDIEGTQAKGFRASPINGPRIDWIAASKDWEVVDAGIDRTAKDGRTPSDHFAVKATLRPI